MVLYHAISSYQLLNVMVHAQTFHSHEKKILILPDFIVTKYPQYKKIAKHKIFHEVFLFPYLLIPHHRDTVLDNVIDMYTKTIPYDIHAFTKIYVAGTHFYFSLYLIVNKIHFSAFEDAYGMLDRSNTLYFNLKKMYPVHAEIVQEYGLFDMSCQYIQEIICAEKSKYNLLLKKTVHLFNFYNYFNRLSFLTKRKIICFFTRKRFRVPDNSVIILTQHFSNLGVMSLKQQAQLYQIIFDKIYPSQKIYIKKHPDDLLDYSKLNKNVKIINGIFPSELLPILCKTSQAELFTISSTGGMLLQPYFKKYLCLREEFPTLYDEKDEFNSIIKILNTF